MFPWEYIIMGIEEQPFHASISLEKSRFTKHVESIRENIDGKSGRAWVEIRENNENFTIYIGAGDIASLRAVMGSIQKWLVIADRIFSGD